MYTSPLGIKAWISYLRHSTSYPYLLVYYWVSMEQRHCWCKYASVYDEQEVSKLGQFKSKARMPSIENPH